MESQTSIHAKRRAALSETIAYVLASVFAYTLVSKLLDFDTFHRTIGHAPAMKPYAVPVAVTVLLAETVASILLLQPGGRRQGLYLSAALLSAFTLYLAAMLVSGSSLPCSCGGVVSDLSWEGHVVLNTFLIGLCVAALAASGHPIPAEHHTVTKKLLQ